MSPVTLLFRAFTRRDGGSGNGSTVSDGSLGSDLWWESPTAYAIKWGIIGGIFVLFLLLFLGSYLHAQRRLKRGLAPLGYHRWLLTRSQRERFEPPPPNDFSFYRVQDGYTMHGYAPPPPAYHADSDNVPAYTPPEGASKAKPVQSYAEMPPPGLPPSHSEGGPSHEVPTVTITPPQASSTSYPTMSHV